MCLHTITKTYNPPDENERTAFKIVSVPFNHQIAATKMYKTPYMNKVLRVNEWLHVELNDEFPIYTGDRKKHYIPYFHTFPTLEEARIAYRELGFSHYDITIRVKVRGVVYEGTDGSDTVPSFLELGINNLVSTDIFVPEDCEVLE